MDVDLVDRAARPRRERRARLPLRPLAVTRTRCARRSKASIGREMFERTYADVYTGDPAWRELPVPEGSLFAWDDDVDLRAAAAVLRRHGARARPRRGRRRRALPRLARRLGDDRPHLAGGLDQAGRARRAAISWSTASSAKQFNSYGSRRGNHEVMVRGTFANVRLRNLLVPGSEGTWTVHLPSGEEMSIFEAAERYLAEGVPTDRPRRQGVRLGLVARLGGEGARTCSACGRRSPRATSGSTARTS